MVDTSVQVPPASASSSKSFKSIMSLPILQVVINPVGVPALGGSNIVMALAEVDGQSPVVKKLIK